MITDEVNITISAGEGGDGAVSFRREAFVPKGGPDGGDGGDGGDVIMVGSTDLTALNRFRYQKQFAAENGGMGLRKKKSGKNGRDLTLTLPVGTLIADTKTGETWEILDSENRLVICHGGKGGRGNWQFRAPDNTTPKQFGRGGRGRKRELYLELKLIADVGLIGLPNAGKSSLLNALTRARAQVANYPFTTLEPNLGVTQNRLILADIPGLIEGAAGGKGLGHKFLRHIQRTKVLVHCMSVESEDIQADYATVRRELEEFDQALLKKPEIIALTKIDLSNGSQIKQKVKQLKGKIVPVSIHQPETLKALLDRVKTCV